MAKEKPKKQKVELLAHGIAPLQQVAIHEAPSTPMGKPGKKVTTAKVRKNGRIAVSVPPGSYVVVAKVTREQRVAFAVTDPGQKAPDEAVAAPATLGP